MELRTFWNVDVFLVSYRHGLGHDDLCGPCIHHVVRGKVTVVRACDVANHVAIMRQTSIQGLRGLNSTGDV